MSEHKETWTSCFVDVMHAHGMTEADAINAAEESYKQDPNTDPVEAAALEMSYWETDDRPSQRALEERGQQRLEGMER